MRRRRDRAPKRKPANGGHLTPVEVRRAKVRVRGEAGAAEKIRFSSSILPKWARRTKSLDALLPVLYFALAGVASSAGVKAATARRANTHWALPLLMND